MFVRIRVGLRVVRGAVRDERARQHSRSVWNQMTEPRGPCAVVGNPAEVWDQLRGGLRVAAREARLSFVEHGLIEPGTAAA